MKRAEREAALQRLGEAFTLASYSAHQRGEPVGGCVYSLAMHIACRESGRLPVMGTPAAEWFEALREWYRDGDFWRMALLVRNGIEPPPEMAEVVRVAVSDRLYGKPGRTKNQRSSLERQTLHYRARRSWQIRNAMLPAWENGQRESLPIHATADVAKAYRGDSLPDVVARCVNAEWDEGLRNREPPWYVPRTEGDPETGRGGTQATAATVRSDCAKMEAIR